MVILLPPPTVRRVQLEGPQEVVGVFESWADCEDLVDEILHTDDTVLAEFLLNQGVVGEGNAAVVQLAVASLVDELANRLQVGVARINKH